MEDRELIKLALEARKSAYAPYSGCKVGAALLTSDGAVYTGCNIENASFGLTVCAERTAFFKAVSGDKKEFEKIAVTGGRGEKPDTYFYPCGACRQVMSEFCSDNFIIITALSEEEFVTNTLNELLPKRFGREDVTE